VERVLFRFTKPEQIKSVGHLDLMRVFERAMRRSGFPVAYSQGFNPRPRMAFAAALTTNASSEAELCQLDLAKDLDSERVALELERLQAQLPGGIVIVRAWPIPLERRSPYVQANAATYDLHLAGPAVMDRAQKFMTEGPAGSKVRAWNAQAETDDPDRVMLTIELPVGERDGVRIRDLIAEMREAMPEIRVMNLHRARLRCELEPDDNQNPPLSGPIGNAVAA
jgi:radical SAM-linked protein